VIATSDNGAAGRVYAPLRGSKTSIYDLSETMDVAAANPDVVEKLAALMQQYIDNVRSTPGEAQKNGVEMTLEKSGNVRKKPWPRARAARC